MRNLPPDAAFWRSKAEAAEATEAEQAAEAVRAAAITPGQFRAAFESGAV